VRQNLEVSAVLILKEHDSQPVRLIPIRPSQSQTGRPNLVILLKPPSIVSIFPSIKNLPGGVYRFVTTASLDIGLPFHKHRLIESIRYGQ